MKVKNMTSNRTGRAVPNQFIIIDDRGAEWFQSYRTVIAIKGTDGKITLDHNWNYWKSTGKYRNQFLGETKKETEAKIANGTYIVTDLN